MDLLLFVVLFLSLAATFVVITRQNKLTSEMISLLKGSNSHVERLISVIEILARRLANIRDHLLAIMPKLYEKSSPLQKNAEGDRIANALDLHAVVATHAKIIHENLHPANADEYEIQQICFSYAQDDLFEFLAAKNPDLFQAISRTAYNEGIPREEIFQLIGILLRDAVGDLLKKDLTS